MGAFRGSVPNFFCALQIFLYPEKFVLNIYHNKIKNIAPLTVYVSLQSSKPGYRCVLCQPTLPSWWHSYISASANFSDFSPHIIFAVS